MNKTKYKKAFDLGERTLSFAKNVISLCRKLKNDLVNREVVKQLVRSACSIGANYREANESLSKKDFAYRIKICRKEAKESSYWLRLLEDGNDEFKDDINKLLRESIELKKIFSSILNKSR